MAISPLKDPGDVVPEILFEWEYYTEGPVLDEKGDFFFTDLAGGSINVFQKGIIKKWGKGKQPNGQAIHNGRHLVCDSFVGAVILYEGDGGKGEKLSPAYIGDLKVSCPNDIAIDQENGFYFTDSVRHRGAVFFVGWDGSAKLIARNIDYANGIVFHKAKQLLFVAESYKNRILKIDLKKNKASPEYISVFHALPFNKENPETGNLPDGLALDENERLWVAHYGMQAVQVISSKGKLLTSYNSGIRLTSNICFKGEEIWITGGSGEPGPGMVARLGVGVKGFPL